MKKAKALSVVKAPKLGTKANPFMRDYDPVDDDGYSTSLQVDEFENCCGISIIHSFGDVDFSKNDLPFVDHPADSYEAEELYEARNPKGKSWGELSWVFQQEYQEREFYFKYRGYEDPLVAALSNSASMALVALTEEQLRDQYLVASLKAKGFVAYGPMFRNDNSHNYIQLFGCTEGETTKDAFKL